MLKILLSLFCLFPILIVYAQQITNIEVVQNGDNVVIYFDISSDQPLKIFDMKVKCSTDNGKTFSILPQALSGDLKGIIEGTGKRIVWDVLSERQELAGDQFVFQLMATINNPPNSFSSNSGTFTDARDGQVYKWVRIGAQIWMAENLKTTKYRNGDSIPYITEDREWSILTSGAFCNYNNNINNANVYGHLYNWYTVNDNRNIAPMGWHVPSNEEWTKLANSLGGVEVAGGKMKFTNGWKDFQSRSGNGNNISGFAGLPGGYRYSNGPFNISGSYGFWWSSEESIINGPYSWTLFSSSKSLAGGSLSNRCGLSVRCVKD